MSDWHPDAKRDPYPPAGPFSVGGKKIVWHTTEGTSLPKYSGSAPHFTVLVHTGELYQHVPISQASSSLEHPPGTAQTNKAGCIQVEIAEFARNSKDWPDKYYEQIASLARWIERNAKVESKCSVKFTDADSVTRMSESKFTSYRGHCGHQHVPHNSHWDPGEFQINKVLTAGISSKGQKWQEELDKLRRIAKKREQAGKKPWTLAMRTKGRMLKGLIAREKKKG